MGDVYFYLKGKVNIPEFEVYIHAMNGVLVRKQIFKGQDGPDYKLDFDPIPGNYIITIYYEGRTIKDRFIIH